jgi:archaemetzincin
MRCIAILVVFTIVGCRSNDSLPFFKPATTKKIYVQPFNDLAPAYAAEILSEVKKLYSNVTLLPPIELPKHAWYRPRNRYRADSLIAWLKDRMQSGEVVVGITSKDISTTKNDVKDYGVMGLGFRPGKACVASTFRLNKERITQQLFKVVIHELGHTQGLHHCPVQTCFMRDAKGRNPTDEEKAFCEKCRKVLIAKGWNL